MLAATQQTPWRQNGKSIRHNPKESMASRKRAQTTEGRTQRVAYHPPVCVEETWKPQGVRATRKIKPHHPCRGSSSSGALEGREGSRGMPELGTPSGKSLPMLSGPHSGAPSAQSPPGGTSHGCAEYFELWRREKGTCQLSELRKAEPPTPHVPHWGTEPP